jgi:hypothetical protein
VKDPLGLADITSVTAVGAADTTQLIGNTITTATTTVTAASTYASIRQEGDASNAGGLVVNVCFAKAGQTVVQLRTTYTSNTLFIQYVTQFVVNAQGFIQPLAITTLPVFALTGAAVLNETNAASTVDVTLAFTLNVAKAAVGTKFVAAMDLSVTSGDVASVSAVAVGSASYTQLSTLYFVTAVTGGTSSFTLSTPLPAYWNSFAQNGLLSFNATVRIESCDGIASEVQTYTSRLHRYS